MQPKIKVNIIGAGISGLATGSYLQMNGFETQIFEKHSIPGGLCTSWQNGEYTIDGSIHWILGSNKGSGFYKMWSELINMEKVPFHNHDIRLHVDLKNNTDKYGIKTFKLYTNLDKLRDYMLDLSPEDSSVIHEVIQDIRNLQKFELPPVMYKLPLIPSIIRSIKMAKYLKFLVYLSKQKKITNFDIAKKFKSPFLKESFELLFDGEEIKMMILNFPMSFFDKNCAGYPVGGSLSWAQRIADNYIAMGGKIHYNTPVKKILTENNEAKGLLVRNDVIHKSDIVVSTADWYKSVFEYLDGKYVDDTILKLRDGNILDLYYSILLVSFGLKKSYKDYPHFSRFPTEVKLESPCGKSWDRLEAHFYNYDPTLAPEGKTVMACSFYTTNGKYWIDLRKNERVKYREEKKKFTDALIDRLEIKFPGIKNDIEVIDFATPATVLRYTNNWQGSAQGWLPGKNMAAASPVKFTLPNLQNFYYASHWGRAGGGIPISLIQARDVAKLICGKNKIPFDPQKGMHSDWSLKE
ncbi:MAG: NAD(P)/FAD-dependent oxidoreductase [Bacteroidota bacterium]